MMHTTLTNNQQVFTLAIRSPFRPTRDPPPPSPPPDPARPLPLCEMRQSCRESEDHDDSRPLRENLRAALAKHSAKILDFFEKVDHGRSGNVTFVNFARCLPRLGLRSSSEEARRLFDELDVNGTGVVAYKDIQRLLRAGGKAHAEEDAVRLKGHRAVQVGEPPSLAGHMTKLSRGEFSPPYAWYWAFKGKEWDRETATYELAVNEYREARRKARQLARGAGATTRAEKGDVIRNSTNGGPSVYFNIEIDRADGALPVADQVLNALARRSVRVMDLFRDWDDGSGTVMFDEFEDNISKLGIDLPRSDCAALFHAIDTKGSGRITLVELEHQLQRARPTSALVYRGPVLCDKEIVLVLGPEREPAVHQLAHRLADSIGGIALEIAALAQHEIDRRSTLGADVAEHQRRRGQLPRKLILALLSSAVKVMHGPFFVLDFPRSLTALQLFEAEVGAPFYGVELRCPGADLSDIEYVLDELKQSDKLITLPKHTDPLDALRQVRLALCARRKLETIRDAEASLARHDAVRRERLEKKKALEADVARMQHRLRSKAKHSTTSRASTPLQNVSSPSAHRRLMQQQPRMSLRYTPVAHQISPEALAMRVISRPATGGSTTSRPYSRSSAAESVRIASKAYGICPPWGNCSTISPPRMRGSRSVPLLTSESLERDSSSVWLDSPRPSTSQSRGSPVFISAN